MTWQGSLEGREDLAGVFTVPSHYSSGFAIGIIAVDLVYPKMPGNVANATTYPFPVLYKKLCFPIERLFEGDRSLEGEIVGAARELEREGVRAIIGACGYFIHFQEAVAKAVDVPVFLSSLCQLPMIQLAISPKKKILTLAASGGDIDGAVRAIAGADKDRLIVRDVGSLPAFHAIRYGETTLDNKKLSEELCGAVRESLGQGPEIGAILLECSDLPPYARDIQAASGLPVFDFNTMIDLVYHAVAQKRYHGYF